MRRPEKGPSPEGAFRFFITEGRILDKPKQFYGTSIVVETESPAERIVKETIKAGWEPYYVVIPKRVGNQFEKLAGMLEMEVVRY